MAYPKALKEIAERLARIEAHLGIKDDEYEVELPQPPEAAPAAAATDIGDLALPSAQEEALRAAGYTTVESVSAATDDELKAVGGVGAKTVQYIREQTS